MCRCHHLLPKQIEYIVYTNGNENGVILCIHAHSYSRQPDTSDDPMSSDEAIYFVPWTRCPVYFMGLLLGFVYYKLDNEIKLPKVRTHCRHDCLH